MTVYDSVMSRKDPNKPRGRTTAYAFFVIAEKEAFYRVSFMTQSVSQQQKYCI